MSRRLFSVLAILSSVALLSGCAGPNVLVNSVGSNGDVAGFFNGLWHGITIIISFVGSLFFNGINIYEVHNNGAWYNFGFVLGLSLILGGGAGSAASR